MFPFVFLEVYIWPNASRACAGDNAAAAAVCTNTPPRKRRSSMARRRLIVRLRATTELEASRASLQLTL